MDKEMQEKIKQVLAEKNRFIMANNFRLLELEEDHCVLEGIITESSLNPYGTVHGGYFFGLADTAGGTIARMSGGNPVTSSANIVFLHKAKGTRLVAIAKPLKRGKTLTICEVEIFDDQEKMVAKATMEYFNL